MADIEHDFVHLARLALAGKQQDVASLVRRALRRITERRPDLAASAAEVLALATAPSLTRTAVADPLPVDSDTRFELLRRETDVCLDLEPVWDSAVASALTAVIEERHREAALRQAGLEPTRSLLFVGPPGVGKTLAARWLAFHLRRTLLSLDLSAVMSSFLGRTGTNIRVVLEYAKRAPCVLLLDEFDAIAKRRDDAAEVGELKRLVTVLLQEVDAWPADGLLVAATNHPELLDPAVWRRFERVVQFPSPSISEVRIAIERLLGSQLDPRSELLDALAFVMHGLSYADVVARVNQARRAAVISGTSIPNALALLAGELCRDKPLKERIGVAKALIEQGHSQRTVSELTGVSRDTLRKNTGSTSSRSKAKR